MRYVERTDLAQDRGRLAGCCDHDDCGIDILTTSATLMCVILFDK
jgi:hypothetical protein